MGSFSIISDNFGASWGHHVFHFFFCCVVHVLALDGNFVRAIPFDRWVLCPAAAVCLSG